MNWNEFIREAAIDRFSSATIRLTFIVVFTNYDKSLEECRIILDKDIKTIGGHLRGIYVYFESEYPKLKGFTKKRPELIRYLRSLYASHGDSSQISDRPQPLTNHQNIPTPEPIPELATLEFIGRDRDLTNLANLSRQAKIVLIKAGAGVGKSTLAREFLQTHFKKVIRLEMGLESGNVTPAEEKVSQILRKDFDEEPSRDFGINLDILREKLADRANPIGVLIDNLEPALDENYRFREKLRGYDALLAVLGDRDVFSFTLITSRRSLITPRAKVHEYSLEGLDITSWQQYFHDCENAVDSEALMQMCVAYNGNAKVMDILHGAIKNRFDGNIGAYWSRYKDALLADSELETLISVEMDWLRDNQPDAYKLLCRMGCYRYQDVKTVPFEGLICLLWDVPESQKIGVVQYLSKTSLIEVKNEYYLHPAIREIAKSLIQENKMDWETANQKMAQYWTNKVLSITTTIDALTALEAYHHYIEICDFDNACNVLLQRRRNNWAESDPLGRSLYRLGFLDQGISIVKSCITGVTSEYKLSGLTNILGVMLWIKGRMSDAIDNHLISGRNALKYVEFNRTNCLSEIPFLEGNDLYCSSLLNLGLCYMSLWELEKSLQHFDELYLFASKLNHFRYIAGANFCRSFIYSCIGRQTEAKKLADFVKNRIQSDILMAWGVGYRLIFLALTYKNLEQMDLAHEMYLQAITFSQSSQYNQVLGLAKIGIAEIYRSKEIFDQSLSCHFESIKILYSISAKCDLAEAYFQLGLTYQAMGEYDQAEEYKAKALELFAQMGAPKQIERVNKAFGGNIQ